MNTLIARALILAALVLPARLLPAQDILQSMYTSAYEDVAEIKRQAEAGNARAQHKLANTLSAQFRNADALEWYAKAAHQGDLESLYQAGHILLFGAFGTPQDQRVLANPPAGIRLVYCAATNHHHEASHDLYRAYKEGCGVCKDLVQAYAWLQLYTDTAAPSIIPAGRAELNQLALQVDTATSQEGKRLAALYRSGHWPELVLQSAPPPQPTACPPVPLAAKSPTPLPSQLKLTGITLGRTPLAMINGKTLAVGETATIPGKPQSCSIKVLAIAPSAVLVSVDDDPQPRQLRLK